MTATISAAPAYPGSSTSGSTHNSISQTASHSRPPSSLSHPASFLSMSQATPTAPTASTSSSRPSPHSQISQSPSETAVNPLLLPDPEEEEMSRNYKQTQINFQTNVNKSLQVDSSWFKSKGGLEDDVSSDEDEEDNGEEEEEDILAQSQKAQSVSQLNFSLRNTYKKNHRCLFNPSTRMKRRAEEERAREKPKSLRMILALFLI